MKNIFGSYTFTWYEMGAIKLALIAIGISSGIYWQSFFSAYIEYIWGVAIIASIYSLVVGLKQLK